ncbi:MAG: hypothetical protein SFU83_22185 [Meiothermus sp.]|nr:hypothetical protein [Meiothermus sp.]
MYSPWVGAAVLGLIWLTVWGGCLWMLRQPLPWAVKGVLLLLVLPSFWTFFAQLARLEPRAMQLIGEGWGSIWSEPQAFVLGAALIFLAPLWYFVLLARVPASYVLHPKEAPVLFTVHMVLLVVFVSTLLLNPYSASEPVTTPSGRVLGRGVAVWNPWLEGSARAALLAFPYAWVVWIQRRQVNSATLSVQLLFAGGAAYWLLTGAIPDACDYSNPWMARMGLCG